MISFEDIVSTVLAELDKKSDDIASLGPSRLCTFVEHCPILDVETELIIQRNRHRDRPIDPNDIRDLAHLELAIPHCDAVVTEKFWCDLVRRSHLDKKYDCLVTHDVREIEPLLSTDKEAERLE